MTCFITSKVKPFFFPLQMTRVLCIGQTEFLAMHKLKVCLKTDQIPRAVYLAFGLLFHYTSTCSGVKQESWYLFIKIKYKYGSPMYNKAPMTWYLQENFLKFQIVIYFGHYHHHYCHYLPRQGSRAERKKQEALRGNSKTHICLLFFLQYHEIHFYNMVSLHCQTFFFFIIGIATKVLEGKKHRKDMKWLVKNSSKD